MAKQTVYGELESSVRDFKILLYSIDEGAECAATMTAASFVLQIVLTAMQIEMIRSKDVHDIKACLNRSIEMTLADKFESAFVPEVARCIDLALKYARIVKPANLNKAVRTYETNSRIPARHM